MSHSMRRRVMVVACNVARCCAISFVVTGCNATRTSPVIPFHSNGGNLTTVRQSSAWSEPVNLGRSINTAFSEFHSAISADELSIFFASDRPGGFGANDLWVAHRKTRHDAWGPAQNLGAKFNTASDEAGPFLTPDDHWLFFASGGKTFYFHQYAAYRKNTSDNFGWEKPFDVGSGVNSHGNNADATLFVDPHTGVTTFYFARLTPGSTRDWDIYASTLGEDGAFSSSGKHGTLSRGVLVPELSSPYRDTHPTIRRDGLEIYISSNRPGSLGNIDLWCSTRPSTHDKWSTPVNLGPSVNSTSDDRAPYLSHDGKTLFFTSNRPGGFGNNDFYMTTREIIIGGG